MSITKTRVKSAAAAVGKHKNEPTTTTATAATSTSTSTTNCHTSSKSSAFSSPPGGELRKNFQHESPKVLHKQKSKILPLSAATTNATGAATLVKLAPKLSGGGAAIVAGTAIAATTTTATTASAYYTGMPASTPVTASVTTNAATLHTCTTPTLPQSNLLKIEPFVPSLGSRLQKPIRRSYSTLSTTALRKRLHNVNTNVVVNLEIASNVRKATIVQQTTNVDPAGQGAVNGGTATALPKVAKQPTVVRRRQPLRGMVNRQRSKSTSSSNSASNRPTTSLANAANTITTTANTPTLGTPCSSPHNAVVIAQPNGICRIQRNAKEQEKLPDRINYDKRGLTAIPIFENESNLRLLSLQHNLINTFHIPKDVKEPETPKQETGEKGRETPPRNTDLVIANSTNYLHPPGLIINRSRYPLNGQVQSPNIEYPAHGHAPLTLQNVATANHHHVNSGFGSYMLQRNKLLHRSINLNNVNLQQNLLQGGGSGPPLRFGMRKSKSFVNNFNLQYQAARRGLQNPRAALLKKPELSANLKSFDSSTSNLTTDSGCALLTPDIGEEEEEAAEQLKTADLEIKNRQLLISYGNIFQNLVFLDLYNNQIERIANLDGLTALTVLLLGKNRIVDISGLASLKATLRVLDLHGNKLCSIANKINCLKELKSLNLAGNQIRQINHNDFLGLANLKELNLKRNKLKRVNGFQHLLALERLWLCHNDLHKVDDMSTIAKACQLIEVTIENNPVSLAGDCVSFLVSHLPKLQTLSQMPITEQVRIAAMTWRTNKELSDQSSQQGDKEQFNLIRREEIISNARTNWELLRSQQMLQQQGNGHGSSSSSNSGSSLINHKSVKSGSKHNKELEKISEANEQSYEEFIKLPPIQTQHQQEEINDNNREERTSSASSLGPNVNSSSSCYSSGDEETEVDDTNHNKHQKSVNKKTKNPQLSDGSAKPKTSNNDAKASLVNPNHIRNGQDSTSTASSCPPTLTIQFPVDTQDGTTMSNISINQNQTANHSSNQTSLMHAATSMGQATSTSATPSSTSPVPSPSSATGCNKRYMTGTLMRSQTIVGPGGAVAANGYTIKANANASATNTGGHNMLLRYQTTKLNPANTLAHPTTIAASTTTAAHQQTSTAAGGALVTASMTMATTTIGNSIQAANTTSSPVLPSPSSPKTLNGHTSPGFMGGCITSSMSSTKTSSATAAAAAAASQLIGTASNTATTTTTKLTAIEREREQGGDYLIEICGRYLNIYGQGALRFIDKQWNPSKANDVHTLNFSYINFNNITTILGRIKVRFPHAENFVFRETNINCLGQLNAVAELQGITSLFIDPEGNPLTLKDLWREYAIYRLSHWGLKRLNAQEVTQQDIDKANLIYAGLSDLILWSMPDAMLQPLLTRLRLDESCTASKMLPKQWLQKPDNRSLRLVVGKEALQWKKCHQQEALHSLPTPQQIRQFQAQLYGGTGASGGVDVNHQLVSSSLTASTATTHPLLSSATSIASSSSSSASMLTQRERGKIHFTIMMENTCNAVEKLHKLEQMWPLMLSNIVRNTLLDYSQLDVYLRNLMGEIMK